ncbi:sensor histidine kinase [Pelagicoccus mobilis]|uniref:Oxygen sensor histidine kinase NreB n=1 Tax=Pelagicoccus mobilis TaxID=415221 RepID=A0A934RRZ4_9BACT|nr:sensor histidine kinase [Pelagicoccus mobilis]MBK1875792.1 sensor histidine kinase [Pelagicoccus mobilis]
MAVRFTPSSSVIAFLVTLFLGVSSSLAVSPKNPGELVEQQAQEKDDRSGWLLTRISELETERDELIATLAQLPRHDPVVFQNHLGFHSAFELSEGEDTESPHTLTFSFWRRQFIRSIALAPATSPFGPADEAYAFPRRFKVEVLEEAAGEYSTVVDWMEEDFPNPGAYPAFFSDIELWADEIRITVPKRDENGDYVYFALGEIYFFGGKPAQPLDNVALWNGTSISSSDSFSLLPHWDVEFLRDRVNNLGFPVMENRDESRKDMIIIPEDGPELPEEIEIIVDFSAIGSTVGRMDIWPAEPPKDLALLGFGFPEDVTIEFSTNKEFEGARGVAPQAIISSRRTAFRSLFSARVRPLKARYARIRMSGLQEVNGRRILGLGEIALYRKDGSLARGAIVSITGVPEEYQEELMRLQDGYSWGRQILSELEWIKGLAERRPIDQRLALVRRELGTARKAWRSWQRRLLYMGGGVLVVFFLGALIMQHRKRKRMLRRLGERITRDLHDEVGSNLGSITLLADDLAGASEESDFKEDLDDLSLMAREANASLREIVWGSEQKSVSLSDLLKKLIERAERVLRGVELKVDLPQNCPDVEVPLTAKRHLIMFFKEVVHNCARHAEARKLSLSASIIDAKLCLSIQDDGVGFDVSKRSSGWGLSNMKKRGEELGGEVDISSKLGEGTLIEMRVPLEMLSKEPKHSYKTSN